jgi:hypothetical protein
MDLQVSHTNRFTMSNALFLNYSKSLFPKKYFFGKSVNFNLIFSEKV